MRCSLKPNENCFIVLADENNKYHTETSPAQDVYFNEKNELIAKTFQSGINIFSMSDGTLKEIDAGTIPSSSKVTDCDITLQEWKAVSGSLAKEDMETVSVSGDAVAWNKLEGMDSKTGVATYSSTFNFAGDPSRGDGAYLEFDYVSDTMTVSVNGLALPEVNQLSKKVDLEGYLRKGINTFNVYVTSNNANTQGGEKRDYGIDGEVIIHPYKILSVDKGTAEAREVKVPEADNNSNAPKEGRFVSACSVPIMVGGTPYNVTYNETMLVYTGKNLKSLLSKALVFTDANGNRKEIKSVSAKATRAGTVKITKIVFTDNAKLKGTALSGLNVKIAPREITDQNVLNQNGAAVYAKFKSGKLNNSGTKLKIKAELPNWSKKAKDASKDSLNPKKPYMTKKISSKDYDFKVNGNDVTIIFKNNYKGSISFKK